jgi:hypothetical protein
MNSRVVLIVLLLTLFGVALAHRRIRYRSDNTRVLWNPFGNIKKFFDNAGAKIKSGFNQHIVKGFHKKIINPSQLIVNKIKKEDIGNKIKHGFNKAVTEVKKADIGKHIKNTIVEYGNNVGNTYKNLVKKMGKKETWQNYLKNPFSAAMDVASFTNPGMVTFSAATEMMAKKIPHVGNVIHDMNPWTTVKRIGNKYGTEAGWKQNIKHWQSDPKNAGAGLAEDLSEATNFIPGASSGLSAAKTASKTAIKAGLKAGLKAGIKTGLKQGLKKGVKLGFKQGFKGAKMIAKQGIAKSNKMAKTSLKSFVKKKAKEFANRTVNSVMQEQ